jgi:hypothetical protein
MDLMEFGTAAAIDGILAGIALPNFNRLIHTVIGGTGMTDRFEMDLDFSANLSVGRLNFGYIKAKIKELNSSDGHHNGRYIQEYDVLLYGFGAGNTVNFGYGLDKTGVVESKTSFQTSSSRYLQDFAGIGWYGMGGWGTGPLEFGENIPTLGLGLSVMQLPDGSFVPDNLNTGIPNSFGFGFFNGWAFAFDMAIWTKNGRATEF